MKSVFSLIAILFLLTSSIPLGFAETPIDSLESETSPIVSSAPKESRNISISLQESIGMTSNDPQKKSSSINPNTISQSEDLEKVVYFSENLKISSSIFEQSVVHNMFVEQPQTSLDRISQIEKIKDRKKNLKIDSLLSNELIVDEKIESSDLLFSEFSSIQVNPLSILENINLHNLDQLFLFNENLFVDNLDQFTFSSDIFTNISFSETDQQYVLILFAPLVFFLLLYSEDFKFKISKLHKPLSFVLIVIILSTVAITPYSISSSYWPMAYADDSAFDDNTTASADNTSSSSTPAEDTETSEASTSDSTDSPVDSTSSSSTPAEDTESTEVSSSTQPTASADNTSSSSTPAEDTETSEASTSDSTDSPVDSTSSSSTPAEDTESTEVSSSTQPTASADNTSSSSTPAEDTETSEASTSDSTDSPVDSTSSSSTPAEDTESTEASSNQTSINNVSH